MLLLKKIFQRPPMALGMKTTFFKFRLGLSESPLALCTLASLPFQCLLSNGLASRASALASLAWSLPSTHPPLSTSGA